ncbi:MAG TPA: alpha/beta hydrolase, partial [Acidimicrobiales bacterium]|nr:alpha/beta hydrolase [Acidimicrobiales bacterium]
MRGRALAPLILLATACSLTNRTGVAEGTIPPVTSTAVPATATPATAAPALTWQACGTGRQCATLSVPLDYSHPDGRHIGIALERHPATGARLGSLVLNPGGPGESGIDSMDLFLSTLSNTLVSRYDLVTFDPRGVGRSAPIHCLDSAGLDRFLAVDPAPPDAAGLQSLLAEDRVFAAGCQAQSGDLLPFVGTADAARDMDLIRQALGEPKLTYLGFSYGSLLGAMYAAQFPTHVRAMVLDGAVDPALDSVSTSEQQATGFDKELNAFFAYCAATTSCAWHPGNDQRAAFDNLLASIRAHPLVVGNRTVGPGEAYLGVVTPLYSKDNWPDLGLALQRAFQGDGSVLLQLFDFYTQRRSDGTYPNTVEANAAIDCADQQWPSDLGQYPALASTAAKTAPEFGPANIYSGMVCALWPYRTPARPAPTSAPGAPPIVVVGSTGDPATPYAWAQSLARELTSGVLLTRQGEGHTGYQSSACIRG